MCSVKCIIFLNIKCTCKDIVYKLQVLKFGQNTFFALNFIKFVYMFLFNVAQSFLFKKSTPTLLFSSSVISKIHLGFHHLKMVNTFKFTSHSTCSIRLKLNILQPVFYFMFIVLPSSSLFNR